MLSSTIFNVFAKSPIKPMQEHMADIYDCATTLLPFMSAVLAQDWSRAENLYQKILAAESQADEKKKHIRLHLPNSFFMAISRSELLTLLTTQDKIASKVKHLAGLIIARHMVLPTELGPQLLSYVKTSIQATELANKAIAELSELIENGFRGPEVELVAALVLELDQVERMTDQMQVDLRAAVFKLEAQLPPVDVIFIYKAIDWIAELADRAQHVGNLIESFIAR